MAEYWLYLDESGDFEDGKRKSGRGIVSLVGGVLAPKPIAEGDAWAALQQMADHQRGKHFHATKGSPTQKERWGQALSQTFRANDWQPVIFEHSTGAEVVDNATTYLMVLAEGAAQLGADLASAARDNSPITTHFCVAGRTANVRGAKDREYITGDRHTAHLRERIGIEQIRAFPAFRRKLSSTVTLADARKDPRLMVADLLCHLWFKRHALDEATRRSLMDTVGRFRYATLVKDERARLRQAIQNGRLGVAMNDAVELWLRDRKTLVSLSEWSYLMERLASLSDESLSRELEAGLARVEARATIHRPLARNAEDSGTAREIAAWMGAILGPLREKMGARDRQCLDWAQIRLDWTQLTALNHRGALSEACQVSSGLDTRLASLPLDIEHLPLALEVQFAQAVHQTDACAYSDACNRMDALSDNLESIVGLLSAIWPGGGDPEARSRLLGKSLGCSLQAWHKRGRRDSAAYAEARSRSEKALALFATATDLRRQAGYRALLEADAGDLGAAWSFLGLAAGVDGCTEPDALLDSSHRDPWLVMYWSHLAYVEVRRDARRAKALLEAWNKGAAREADWLGDGFRFPGHLVAWKMGVVAAVAGKAKQAARLLDVAVEQCLGHRESQALRFIGLAVLADYAASSQPNKGKPLLQKLAREVDLLHSDAPASMASYLDSWLSELKRQREAKHLTAAPLRDLAWQVCY